MERPRSAACAAAPGRPHVDGGAGGRINVERTDEAAATGAETLGVACPYCLIMLDDGAKAAGSDMRVADIATLLAEATLGEPTAQP